MLWAHSSATGTQAIVYTCPVGTTVVLKSFYAQLQVGTAQDVALVWQRSSPTVQVTIVSSTVAAWSRLEWQGWIVLEAGDELILAYATPPLNSAGFGAELPG